MKVAVIGSRDWEVVNLGEYLPKEVTMILSGGAKGVDASARRYALENGIPLREFVPQYEKYGRAAPLYRNLEIIEEADLVLAFWNGVSRGTKFVIENCEKKKIPLRVIRKK